MNSHKDARLSGIRHSCLHQVVLMTAAYLSIASPLHAETSASTSIADAAWRLSLAGQYEPLTQEALAKRVAEHPLFCKDPRPDVRQELQDDSATPQQWFMSNEAGVLRWWSHSSTSQLIWADSSEWVEPQQKVSKQVAIVASPTSASGFIVVWPEFSLNRYAAVDLTQPEKPVALWQWQAPILGSVQTPVNTLLRIANAIHPTLVMVSGEDAVQPTFWLVDAITGKQLAEQQYHHSLKTVELPFVLKDLIAAPAALDRNADGFTDRLYFIDKEGRLVQVDIEQDLKLRSRVVADLSDFGAEFVEQVVATRALLPDEKVPVVASTVTHSDATESALGEEETAGVAAKPADVVMLMSRKKQQSQLWVLPIPDSPEYNIQPHHLTLRDLSTHDVADVNTMIATAGWYGTLPAAPVALPQVFAGVLYLPVAPTTERCAGARQATELVARHLYQGSSVYSAEQLASLPIPFGMLSPVRRGSGEIALQDRQQGKLLLPSMQGIRADCRFCTEVLQQNQYPKWQRIAIYQHESEMY
jgi:hypothetical protein